MIDRRPLGTGPRPADTEVPGAPRASLAAERLEPHTDTGTAPAAAPSRPDGRRTLGAGPAPERTVTAIGRETGQPNTL
jgi:hypothetical protein